MDFSTSRVQGTGLKSLFPICLPFPFLIYSLRKFFTFSPSSFTLKALHNSCGRDSSPVCGHRTLSTGNIVRLSHMKQTGGLLGFFPYLGKPPLFFLNIKTIWQQMQPEVVIYFVSLLKVRIVVREHTEWILLASHNGPRAGIALEILLQKKCQACTHPSDCSSSQTSWARHLITSFVPPAVAAVETRLRPRLIAGSG